jgi:autotransporter-associated beta strand protein
MSAKVILSVGRLLALLAIFAGAQTLYGGSATWNLNPTSNDWNTAENWMPVTIPNSETDVATFATSNRTSVICADSGDGFADTYVDGIIFAPGASAYTVTITPSIDVIFPSLIVFYGEGITNSSGNVQNFVTANSGSTKASGRIYFQRAASAGDNVIITNEGGASPTGDGVYGGFTEFGYDFADSPTAGNATLITNGGLVSGAIGGFALLSSMSNANSAAFINNPGEVSGAGAGSTLIQTVGNIGTATFIGNAATVTGAEGGWVEFDYGTANGANFIANGATSAGVQGGQIYVYGGNGYATFTGRGGRGGGAEGGLIDLFGLPNSDQTIIIARAGSNGALGGHIVVEGGGYHPVLDLAQFQLFGNGLLDLTQVTTGGITVGSLSGNGVVSLSGHTLSIGNNNGSTSFSGLIQDSGAVTKVGTGTLTLAGANSYTGATTVTAGTLTVNNHVGSATGTGSVRVSAGTLGGRGSIAGVVTMGIGSGTGAVLAPSAGSNRLAILTMQRALTFKADSTYTYRLNTSNPSADQVIARGISIESGAQFSFQSLGNRRLPVSTIFIAISNTAGTPISGTFANLPDGSTFTGGRNNYQASYEGGDGNDLTLTVVP